MRRLAGAWHRRVLADEVVAHAFSHGFQPDHVERLAAYWAEALGAPAAYSNAYGDETTVVRIHSGNGVHEEMDRRAIACFDQALADAGLADDDSLRQVLHDYFAWATTTTMARYHRSADDVPEGLAIPRWSWDGLQVQDFAAAPSTSALYNRNQIRFPATAMPILNTPVEARVLGSLVEKEISTPEYYPLSLNALVNACNQKNNREPVMRLEEHEVRDALRALEDQQLAGAARGADSRVTKFEHHLQEIFNFTRGETALLCELLLRGPQTPGELRNRAERLYRFEEVSDVLSVLQRLMQREPALVAMLPRQPGAREVRYTHLLCGEPALPPASPVEPASGSPTPDRLLQLEAEIAQLRSELAELRDKVATITQSPS